MTETIPATVDVLDERFQFKGDQHLQRLATGSRWTEGPVYVPAGRYLLFSDIPNDRMLRWDELTGSIGVFREPADYTNGHTLDPAGRLVSCEHGTRRVTRTEHDGSRTIVAERYNGKRFNSPNDVVVHSDSSVWFTDPTYGIDSDYEGHHAQPEIDGCHVYRVDPIDGTVRLVADDFDRPNGLAFSPDESRLYITDSSRRHIRVFDVTSDGGLTGGALFADSTAGAFDGLRLDTLGRVWAAAADGLHCHDSDGTLLGKLHVPEKTANFTFGGYKGNRLFICASTSVYSIVTNVTGARKPYGLF